jgi:hypothetical protein
MRKRRRVGAAGGAALLWIACLMHLPPTASAAVAETACSESALEDRLSELLDALNRPEAQRRMAAAKADLGSDQAIENDGDMKYLAAAAVFLTATDHLGAGALAEACDIVNNSEDLIDAVVAGE